MKELLFQGINARLIIRPYKNGKNIIKTFYISNFVHKLYSCGFMQVLFKGMCILVANTVQTIESIFQHLLNKHFVSYFHITKHNYDGT